MEGETHLSVFFCEENCTIFGKVVCLEIAIQIFNIA